MALRSPYHAFVDLPRLTFDLDGVLCRPPLGINPGPRRPSPRQAAGRRNLLWVTERWRYAFRGPMPGAVEGFRLLSQRYQPIILSARGPAARPATERWQQRYLGSVPPMHLRPHWRETPAAFKARLLAELRPLAHFEDDPHTAAWAAQIVGLVFLVDWRRNRGLQAPHIHRIHRLDEALPLLRPAPGVG